MFESAELGHAVDRASFKAAVPALREALLEAQCELVAERRFSVLILISGVDGSGKGETVNLLHAWMDPRHLVTEAFAEPSDEAAARPPLWRYWRALPPKGKIGFFHGSWYSEPIARRVEGKMKRATLDQRLADINRLEEMLANEGVLLLKFWLHLSLPAQKKRLDALAADPRTAWRVTPETRARLKTHDRLQEVAGHVLRVTNTAAAPWLIVEGADDAYRSLTVGRAVLAAIRERLAAGSPAAAPVAPLPARPIDQRDVLGSLVLHQKMSRDTYEHALATAQGRLAELMRSPAFLARHSLVVVFEGGDAAGKGGCIRRVTSALDARQYQVVPVAAPSEEERAQPYLWRFWRHVPGHGRATLFDRSWYGRVLVERVEGFCPPSAWQRAYAEINDFEHQLAAAGAIVVKFWLEVSPEEQLQRFQAREETAFKRFKITEEDWRNRARRPDYDRAVCDMVDRTSTGIAPWTLVEADNKRFARVKVLQTLCQRIEEALKADS